MSHGLPWGDSHGVRPKVLFVNIFYKKAKKKKEKKHKRAIIKKQGKYKKLG